MSDGRQIFLNCRTIGEAIAALRDLLHAAGIDEYETDARDLICAAFNVAPIDLILRSNTQAVPEGLARLVDFSKRRLNREPVTRIIGTRGFWTFELAVHPDVLDPRPDSEVVVEACLAAMAGRADEPISILDVGTGSGALIAALLSEFHRARGYAIDVSPHAVAAARRNLTSLNLADRATVLHQSWSDPLPGTFDLVVSNPPYIVSGEISGLDLEVRGFDPALALDGGADGLDAYRAIAERWQGWVKPNGLLALEIGATQAQEVRHLLEEARARLLDLRKDYAGNDRAMIWATEVV